MTSHIGEERWIGYLEDALDPDERAKVARHLGVCQECSKLLTDFEDCEAALVSEAAILTGELGISAERATELAERAVAVLHGQAALAGAARRHFTVHEGLRILQSVLEPIYGSAMVVRVFQLAAARCSDAVADGLQEHRWPEFADRLDVAACEIWGCAAGRAVRRLSIHLPIQKVA